MVQSTKDLVKSQYVRAKAEKTKLESLEQTIKDAEAEIKEIDSLMKTRSERMLKISKAEEDAEKKAAGYSEQSKKDATAAGLFEKANVANAKADLKKDNDAIAKEKATLAKAEKTLTFMKSLQSQAMAKVKMVEGTAKNAQMALDLAEGTVKSKEEEIVKEKDVLKTMLGEEKEMKQALAKEESAMGARIAANKAGLKDLNKFKPDIVKLHSLEPN